MHSIFNKHVAFVLCFIINIMHLYECATQIDVSTNGLLLSPSVSANHSDDAAPTETATLTSRQLRKVVMGNYRSSYVGGSKSNRRLSASINQYQITNINNTENRPLDDGSLSNETPHPTTTTKKKQLAPIYDEFGDEIRYNVGPGVNISIAKDRSLVSVNLDEDCLKDVFTGRGRNKDLITKILPLFILPFLIQSAVVPFLVSTLKLLLIKSIVVGKIAIFLLLFSAFKNHVKYAYEAAAPSYYSDVPNRRTEALIGYRVEGKPAAWVN